jgi:hypothetical protein
MKWVSTKRWWLALALAGASATAVAQDGAVNITAGGQPRDVVVEVKNGPSTCGMQIRFADGREEKKRLTEGEVWTVNHTFAADGNFGIEAAGVLVIRGLRTAGPCNYGNQALLAVAGANASLQVASNGAAQPTAGAAAPQAAQAAQPAQAAPAQGAHQDMVVMVRKSSSNLKFVNTLEGGKRLSNAEDLARTGTSACVIKYPSAYGNLPDTSVDTVARAELRRYLAGLANAKDVAVRAMECITGAGDNARFQPAADLVLIQRQAMPVLANASPAFAQGYEALHEISHASLFALADQMRAAEARRQQALANRAQELDVMAQANSIDKVGSIAFGNPSSSGNVAFCTLSYDAEKGAAVLAYGYRGFNTQVDAFRSQAQRARATFDANRPYAKVYDTVEALYEARQTKPDECLVYVDFPANLKKISAALQRDGKPAPVLGELVSSLELRDAWAKRTGYQDYAEYQTAREMKVNAQQFKQLGEYRIANKAALDAAVRDMQTTRYSNSTDVADVLSFLKDKAEAAGKAGATAVSVRDARQKAARDASAAEAAAEQRRREAYAKDFPYIAVLTCGMPGHINIMACFAGGSRGVDTELKLRNGSSSAMYKVYNLQQAGQERRDGFYIDLRRTFDLRAQNADDTLILSLKIIDRVSGRVVHEDQASRFEVVSARN